MGSVPLKELGKDPLKFLKNNAINVDPKVPAEYRAQDGATFKAGKAFIDLVLVPVTDKKFYYDLVLVPAAAKKPDTVSAFVLGFKRIQTNDVPFLDIPRKKESVTEGTLFFTAGLTGCSVIVTRLDGKADAYRVFHDRRMDSAVLYDNVEMHVNFDDYRMGGRHEYSHTGVAVTMMQFKGGEWHMFLQRQPAAPADLKPPPPEYEIYASAVEHKGPESSVSLETSFNGKRTIIQQRMKSNASKLGVDQKVIDQAKDGVYNGDGKTFNANDPAILGWNKLRTAVNAQIEAARKKGLKPSEIDTYKSYEDTVTDSKDIDETWLWLQMKKHKK